MTNPPRRLLAFATAACALLLLGANNADTPSALAPMPEDPGFWKPRQFVQEAIHPDALPTPEGLRTDGVNGLATFKSDGRQVLAVGPWRAGLWSLRYEFAPLVATPRAQVAGEYRTQDLAPMNAVVRAEFFSPDGKRLLIWTRGLAPADDWTSFSLPIRQAPRTAAAFRIGFGLVEKTEGRVFFRDLQMADAPTTLCFPESPPDLIRPAPPEPLTRDAFVRLEKANGAWWFVAPDGRPFYSVGIDLPTISRKEADDGAGAGVVERLRSAGFNSFGGWTNLWRWSDVMSGLEDSPGDEPLWGFRAFHAGRIEGDFDRMTNGKGESLGGNAHAMPDPWDPAFEKAYRAAARDLAREVRDAPWFAGWFVDNETAHEDMHRYVYSTHCAAKFREFLENKYESVGALNAAWNVAYDSFDALFEARPDPVVRFGPAYEDFAAFSRIALDRYLALIHGVLKEEDPGRLIISTRLAAADFEDALRLIDLYARFDAVAVNLYPANDAPGLSAAERAFLAAVHEGTGKPILIGEWSVPAMDSALYDGPAKDLDDSFEKAVPTQQDRAAQAARLTADFYNIPYVVGAHWFTWSDVDKTTRRANRGWTRAGGEPWTALQEVLSTANRRLPAR